MSKMADSDIDAQQKSKVGEDEKFKEPWDFEELSLDDLRVIILRLNHDNKNLRETELELHKEVELQEHTLFVMAKAMKDGGYPK